jgi:exopolyphosphatase/guanosine-5'-triphosphate,3'-diphosphate pyrophosphatase
MNHASVIEELRATLARLEPEPEHTSHVAHLALRLFDQLKFVHGLGLDERVILQGAAWLHDIGWPVSHGGAAHHKHSARIIREQHWQHLKPLEVELLAQVARYHRRALPDETHAEFRALGPREQKAVRKLAALLRLADALDRSHLQHVRDLKARFRDGILELTLLSRQPPAREIAGAQKKGDLACAVFRCQLTFSVMPVDEGSVGERA